MTLKAERLELEYMFTYSITRTLAVILGILLISFLWVSPASAQSLHALLLRSQPAEGSTLVTSPQALCLWFSESAQPVGNSITVLGPDGSHIRTGMLHVRGTQFCISISIHSTGSYLVSWQVISLDTEPTSGSFIFNLHHSGGVWASTTSSGISIQGLTLQVLARLLHFLGYALSFGTLCFRWLVLNPLRLKPSKNARHQLELLVLFGIGALLLAEPLALLAQIVSLGSADIGSLVSAILASSFGRVLAQRLGSALLLWVILGMVNGTADEYQEPHAARIGMLCLGLLVALVDGEASHAIGKEPIWLALLANMVHIAAMGVWVGGLTALLVLWKEKAVEERRAEVVLRFGQLATIAVSELIMSGLLMAWLRLNQPLNLITTVYGRVLLAKIFLLPLVLLLAWRSTHVERDKQKNWWRIEGLGLLGLLVLAGLLVALPPPL